MVPVAILGLFRRFPTHCWTDSTQLPGRTMWHLGTRRRWLVYCLAPESESPLAPNKAIAMHFLQHTAAITPTHWLGSFIRGFEKLSILKNRFFHYDVAQYSMAARPCARSQPCECMRAHCRELERKGAARSQSGDWPNSLWAHPKCIQDCKMAGQGHQTHHQWCGRITLWAHFSFSV